MNWSDLTDKVLIPFHNADHGLRVSAKKYLVAAQEDFIVETKCLERWKWLYLLADAEYVDLPNDFIEVRRIEWKGRRFEATEINEPYTLHQVDTDYHIGTPEKVFVQGNRLYLVQGTPSAYWLTLWYIYRPNVLTDSATAYRKLSYDALTAHFVYGETVTGGTSGATGVVEYDDNDRKVGTLTLSSVVGTFQDDEALSGGDNGAATANGADSAFATAGDDPDIDEIYRKHLADYARASIYEDLGYPNMSDRLFNRYYQNRDSVREHFQARMDVGPEKIIDNW